MKRKNKNISIATIIINNDSFYVVEYLECIL